MIKGDEESAHQIRDILCSLKEYIYYMMSSGVHEIYSGSIDSYEHEVLGRLEDIRRKMRHCTRCKLSQHRTNIVFGEGNPCAKVLFVGEGPGYEEDQTGRPFVGNAGKKLTEIIERGMQMSRDEVYICNIVKCRPPNNRDPQEDEIRACIPFLEEQIDTIKPEVIITLGLQAAQAIVGIRQPISQARGKWYKYRGIPVMPTYHPSFVLRSYTTAVRRQVWDDVREALRAAKEGR